MANCTSSPEKKEALQAASEGNGDYYFTYDWNLNSVRGAESNNEIKSTELSANQQNLPRSDVSSNIQPVGAIGTIDNNRNSGNRRSTGNRRGSNTGINSATNGVTEDDIATGSDTRGSNSGRRSTNNNQPVDNEVKVRPGKSTRLPDTPQKIPSQSNNLVENLESKATIQQVQACLYLLVLLFSMFRLFLS